ncbi:hypothetical protein [Levilactobacillus brevis]|uniref:hypothetical protein n=1 Tax=Levilactobacillus brevis TaxID=1580 RepID=UPI0035A348CE
MKKHKIVVTGLLSLFLSIGIISMTTSANAAKSYWKSAHWVTFTKNVTVDKVKSSGGSYIKSYTIKAGSHYKLSHWDVNYSWALQSGKFNTNGKYTYIVDKPWNSSNWFKMGIHSLIPKSYRFRTATSTDFFYDSWEPAYLDQNSLGLDLFSNKKDVYGGYEPDKTIDSFTTKLYAKWVSKTQSNNTIMVKIGSNIYYANDSKHDVRPYNANRLGGTIISHFKPTSKSALLKRGTHIYKGTLWTYSYDNDNHDKGYEFNGHKWVHISYLDV